MPFDLRIANGLSGEEKDARKRKLLKARAAARRAVASGRCPLCGHTGFDKIEDGVYHCKQYGKSCNYRCVTHPERREKVDTSV